MSGPRGLVARILHSSAVDGPGNRAVIFLQGCGFDCAYCHNPETRSPTGEDYGEFNTPRARIMDLDEVLEDILRYRKLIRGITVSGGECTLQPEFLTALLRAAAAEGLPGLVDTNGGRDLASLPELTAAAEGFMLDLKAWDEEEHRALTGSSNRNVIANLRILAAAGKLYEVRTVVVPGRFDAELTVRETSRILAASGSPARYKLIKFRPQGVRPAFRELPQPDEGTMEALAALARSEGAAEVLIV